MAIDTSIYRNLLSAPKSIAEFDDEARARQINALALQSEQFKAAEAQRGIAAEAALSRALASGGDVQNQLAQGGFGSRALAYTKSQQEMKKTAADTARLEAQTGEVVQKTKAGAYDLQRKQHDIALQEVTSFNSPADAIASLDDHIKRGEMSPEEGAAMRQRIPTTPAEFKQWQVQTVMGLLDAKERMAYTMPNANTVANNQTSVANTAANNATSRANNASNNAVQMRGQNLTDARARESNGAARIPAGYKLNSDGTMSFIPGGPADPNTKDGKMTEDQSKATGWLIQAENAYGNMKKVAFGENGQLAGAAKPGVADAISDIPFMGALGNSLRSADRQKFVQGASSLSESLLRAATGAGVNMSEAKQKIDELTPVIGDKPEVIQQKFDAIPLYIESLKVRSGGGAKKAAGVMAGKGSATTTNTSVLPAGWSVERN